LDLIEGDGVSWEGQPLETLAQMGELFAYIHEGFWQPMDTLREKNHLQHMWETNVAPWKVW
jgi:glucose-1-phosphate cytidylyltransferase